MSQLQQTRSTAIIRIFYVCRHCHQRIDASENVCPHCKASRNVD